MKYTVTLNGRTRDLVVDGRSVIIDGMKLEAELREVPGTPLRILVLDKVSWPLAMESAGRGSWIVHTGGESQQVSVLDERAAYLQSLVGKATILGGAAALKAPMPGLVVRVLAKPGQDVAAGSSLVVLEAMKMENELKAQSPGTVEEVHVTEGQAVEKGAVLVSFRPPA